MTLKIVSSVLLCSALVLSAVCLRWAYAYRQEAGRDYQDIIDFVSRTEKEGFRQAEFERFARNRKMRQKEVYVAPALIQLPQIASTVCLAAGILLLLVPRLGKKTPNPVP